MGKSEQDEADAVLAGLSSAELTHYICAQHLMPIVVGKDGTFFCTKCAQRPDAVAHARTGKTYSLKEWSNSKVSWEQTLYGYGRLPSTSN